MLIDSCPNRSSSELMEQSLCANINETFQPSSNLNVAETKMIAAVVIAARSLPLPLDFLCFFRPYDQHLVVAPVDRATRPLIKRMAFVLLFLPLPIIFIKQLEQHCMCMISHHITLSYIPLPGDSGVLPNGMKVSNPRG